MRLSLNRWDENGWAFSTQVSLGGFHTKHVGTLNAVTAKASPPGSGARAAAMPRNVRWLPYWREVTMSTVGTRMTVEPGKRGGKPCIRGLRITVWDVLGWLGAGMTEEQILDEHPDLEKADFAAVYQYAAEAGRKANLG